MPSGCVVLALLMIGDVAAATGHGCNQPAATDTGTVRRLFELGDRPPPESLQTLHDYYRSLPEAVRRDETIAYAYAVVLIRHNRLREAAAVLDETTARGAEDAAVGRAKVWLAMALDRRTEALHGILALRELAESHESNARTAIAELFGQISGYLEGPGVSKIRPGDRRRWQEALNLVWSGPDQTKFDRARTGIIDEYRRLYQATQRFKRQAEQSRSKKSERAQHDHDRRAKSVAEKQRKLDGKQAKRTMEARTKSDAIDDKLDEVDRKREALLQEIAPLEAQRLVLISQLLPPPPPPLPGRPEHTPRQAAAVVHNMQIEQMLAPLVVQLNLLEGQLAELGDADFELAVEGWQTDWNYGREMMTIDEQRRELDRQQHRVEHDAKRLKAVETSYARVQRMTASPLTRFITYVPFSFERERARLLQTANADDLP